MLNVIFYILLDAFIACLDINLLSVCYVPSTDPKIPQKKWTKQGPC